MKNQDSSAEFNGHHHEAQKRKWPYEDANSYANYLTSDKGVIAKKTMTTYNYDNFQSNQQYIISTPSNDQEQRNDTNDDGSVNCNQQQQHQPSTQMLNTMEISENIEYVNILYEDDLLTSIQAPVATETNYINFEPNWSNADILDLDQRNFYYHETTNGNTTTTVNLNHLNGQLSQQHNEQNVSSIHVQHPHHQLHHPQRIVHSESQHNLQMTEQLSNNHIHNITEYEIVQNVYPEPDNGQHETSTTNLPAIHDDSEDKNLSWLYNYKLNELPHLSPEVNRSRTETGLQVDKLIQEATSSEFDQTPNSDSNVVVENPANLPKKPPFTYTELIEYALEDKGELTVSGIYNWISDRFPFYKSNDDRWKNSVRHNLSINPHFRKGNKAPQGAGHLWIISTRDSEANLLAWEHKKQRLELFFKMEKTFGHTEEPNNEVPQTPSSQDETLVAVASLTSILERSKSPGGKVDAQYHKTMHANDSHSREDELKKSAGEILNGVKRTVEVQVVNSNTFNFQDQTILDYLNPVPKDQIVHECGLRSSRNNNNDFCSEYFASSDMEPIELGINMNTTTDTDDDGLFGDEFNLNYFITPGSNIMT
ncbi:uncharacterized protein LOC116344149 isoform X2 [Contarinia nasturtii]|uniref:uncharacterized protein LOC116344149 isoform X2 n=1 Tax=Contarinia nasturtii TaxID=265458 RepID=UPI0012D40F27|nr:uncharacterized protein LOC116344149 isoform X2 [Contarinia nasturtii]